MRRRLEGLVLFAIAVVVHHQAAAAAGADRSVPDVYGCARFTVEWVRLPDANIGYLVGDWLTMGMLLTMPMILIGAGDDDLCLSAQRRRAAI